MITLFARRHKSTWFFIITRDFFIIAVTLWVCLVKLGRYSVVF
jgi:hypothetical protein